MDALGSKDKASFTLVMDFLKMMEDETHLKCVKRKERKKKP